MLRANGLVFRRDERTLILGDWNGDLTFCDMTMWGRIDSIEASLSSIAINPSATLVATGTASGSLKIWDVVDRSLAQAISYDGPVSGHRVRRQPPPARHTSGGGPAPPHYGHRRTDIDRPLTDHPRVRPDECATYVLDPCPSVEDSFGNSMTSFLV